MDLLKEWLRTLLEANRSRVNEAESLWSFSALPTPVVEVIFLTCSIFHQSEEVRYLSVELFDRFIRYHFQYLSNEVWNKEIKTKNETWGKAEMRVYSQIPLRMLSCIQLASKFVEHSRIIRPSEIQSYLNSTGTKYTLEQIMASEKRVWKTLKFCLNMQTTLTHVDLILATLVEFSKFPLDIDEVKERAILLTDFLYLHHQEIYRKLFYMSTGRFEATLKEKEELKKIECNTVHRAAAIVGLSVNLNILDDEEETISKNIYHALSTVTQQPSDDIKVLAHIILQIINS